MHLFELNETILTSLKWDSAPNILEVCCWTLFNRALNPLNLYSTKHLNMALLFIMTFLDWGLPLKHWIFLSYLGYNIAFNLISLSQRITLIWIPWNKFELFASILLYNFASSIWLLWILNSVGLHSTEHCIQWIRIQQSMEFTRIITSNAFEFTEAVFIMTPKVHSGSVIQYTI